MNQFWYKYWFSDSLYASTTQLILTLETLILFYLNYGLSYTSNFFIHEYWYKNLTSSLRLNINKAELNNYFRRFYYSHHILNIEHNYLIRNATPEYFPLKIWVFRYLNWIVFIFQWFKPLKKKIFFRNEKPIFKGGLHKKKNLYSPHLHKSRSKIIYLYLLYKVALFTENYYF
jgi:hypothetical protein